MKPVLSIFFDGLKPESLVHMPFLASLPYQRRLETILGYSVTCHASMYTGVYPDKHKLWFLWQHGPQTSPFRWLARLPLLNRLDMIPTWIVAHRLTARRSHLTAYWGIPRLYNLPMRYWPNIDVSEKRYWDEDNYLPGNPTIFELLRSHAIPYEVVGMERGVAETSKLVAEHTFGQIQPWTYLFIGDVDAMTHHFTQQAPEVIERLKVFDQTIERIYKEIQRKVGDVDVFVWSDHGHVALNEKIDLYALFRQAGDNLNRYMHMVDINFARFWFRSAEERRRVEKVLARIQNGFIMSPEDMQRWHVQMPDTRYGELIYYLDAGSAFSRTIFGFGLRQKSIHGYLPSHLGCDGIFSSNRPIADDVEKVRLVDILPSLLSMYNLPIPPHVDGRVIWR